MKVKNEREYPWVYLGLKAISIIGILLLFSLPFCNFFIDLNIHATVKNSYINVSSERYGIPRTKSSILDLPSIINSTDNDYFKEDIRFNSSTLLTNGSELLFSSCNITFALNDQDECSVELGTGSVLEFMECFIRFEPEKPGSLMISGDAYFEGCEFHEQFDFLFLNGSSNLYGNNISVNSSITNLNSSLLVRESYGEIQINNIGNGTVVLEDRFSFELFSVQFGAVEFATVELKDKYSLSLFTETSGDQGETDVRMVQHTVINRSGVFNRTPFTVLVDHPKYYHKSVELTEIPHDMIFIELKPITGQLSGSVKSHTGFLLEGAEINALSSASGIITTISDREGMYEITILASTSTAIMVNIGNHSEDEKTVYLEPNSIHYLNFTLQEDEVPVEIQPIFTSQYKFPHDGNLSISFQKRINVSTLKKNVLLIDRSTNESIPKKFDILENGIRIRISPLNPLAKFSWYSISIHRGLRYWDSYSVVWRNFTYSFKTSYIPLKNTNPLNGAVNVSINPQIIIEFSVPISTETILGNITLVDQNGNEKEMEITLVDKLTISISLPAYFQYSTTYRIIFSTGLKDTDGYGLFNEIFNISFKTKQEPMGPIVNLLISPGNGSGDLDREIIFQVEIKGLDTGSTRIIDVNGAEVTKIDDLSQGLYGINVASEGFQSLNATWDLYDGKIYDLRYYLNSTQDNEEIENTRSELQTLIVIILIIFLFLISFGIMYVIRRNGEGDSPKHENVENTSAPGMDSFSKK